GLGWRSPVGVGRVWGYSRRLRPGNDFSRYYKRRNFFPVRNNDFSRYLSGLGWRSPLDIARV
ncbi:hypothetical protein NG799_09850, partial [Laspinema sp. D1]|nr:hypothetical protein [Laspinema sp. D2a]